MAVLATGWVEYILWYVDVALQFYSEEGMQPVMDPKNPSVVLITVERRGMLWAAYRDAVQISFQIARNNLLIAYEIFGMLSSSFQGNSPHLVDKFVYQRPRPFRAAEHGPGRTIVSNATINQ
jgi:hypothetical protein